MQTRSMSRRVPLYAAFTLTLSLGLVACGGSTPTAISITAPGNTTGSASIAVGATLQLTASTTVTWSSSDTGVVTVSASGVVTGVAAGTATITATSSTGAKATFTVTVTASTVLPSVRVSFRPANATTALPEGFVADTGAAYGTGNQTWGWVTESGDTPTDASGNTRDRGGTVGEVTQRTLILMQCNSAQPACRSGSLTIPVKWEYTLPNGQYSVTVSVGDADTSTLNSVHVIRAEGSVVVPAYTPTAAAPFNVKTASVTVADGKLTIDAVGGTNTKLNYVVVAPTASAAAVR